MKKIRYWLILLLFLLHNDFWNWDRAEVWGWLPVGLWYHLAYCLAVSCVLALLVSDAKARRAKLSAARKDDL